MYFIYTNRYGVLNNVNSFIDFLYDIMNLNHFFHRHCQHIIIIFPVDHYNISPAFTIKIRP